jgi:hypothetical protein
MPLSRAANSLLAFFLILHSNLVMNKKNNPSFYLGSNYNKNDWEQFQDCCKIVSVNKIVEMLKYEERKKERKKEREKEWMDVGR